MYASAVFSLSQHDNHKDENVLKCLVSARWWLFRLASQTHFSVLEFDKKAAGNIVVSLQRAHTNNQSHLTRASPSATFYIGVIGRMKKSIPSTHNFHGRWALSQIGMCLNR